MSRGKAQTRLRRFVGWTSVLGSLNRVCAIASVLAATLALSACGNNAPADAAPPRCTQGTSISCACVNGSSGTQVCLADGTYGACSCGAMNHDAGPMDAYADAVDASDDVPADQVMDTGADVLGEAAVDAGSDAARDAAADLGVDALDTINDAPAEGGVDVSVDIAVDVATDATEVATDAPIESGAPTLVAGGLGTVGPGALQSGSTRILDEGFETGGRLCSANVCVTGAFEP